LRGWRRLRDENNLLLTQYGVKKILGHLYSSCSTPDTVAKHLTSIVSKSDESPANDRTQTQRGFQMNAGFSASRHRALTLLTNQY